MYDFRKVCDVANYLAQVKREEYIRSAISRYYYSLFGCARLYLILIMHEFEFERGSNVHTRVCDRLKYSDNPTEHSLGKRLEKLRELRNLADYDWEKKDRHFFHDNIGYIKDETQIGLEQINSLKNSPPYRI